MFAIPLQIAAHGSRARNVEEHDTFVLASGQIACMRDVVLITTGAAGESACFLQAGRAAILPHGAL